MQNSLDSTTIAKLEQKPPHKFTQSRGESKESKKTSPIEKD